MPKGIDKGRLTEMRETDEYVEGRVRYLEELIEDRFENLKTEFRIGQEKSDLKSDLNSFAAYAPPVPNWFEPVMESEKPKAIPNKSTPDKARSYPYCENFEEMEKWKRAFMEARLYQWPWHWARLALEARPK